MDALVEYALLLRNILTERRRERELRLGYIGLPEPFFSLLDEWVPYGTTPPPRFEPCSYRPALTPLHNP